VIKIAENAGFCFGVRRAVEGAIRLTKEGQKVVTLGELIHNRNVCDWLKRQGIETVSCVDNLKGKDVTAVIRSHGAGPEVYEKLDRLGVNWVDLTCPFVERIHSRVREETEKYDKIVIVGSASHPEVSGILSWAGEKGFVVGCVEDVAGLPIAASALVVAQTTIRRELLEEVFAAVRKKIPDAVLFDSICETTARRQQEAEDLAKISDAMIVVGDPASSNTNKLYEIAAKFCKNTQYVSSSDQLLLEKLHGCDIIHIIAGASTPDWIIREVRSQMSEFENVQANEEVVVAPEESTAAETVAVEEAAQTAAEKAPVEEEIAIPVEAAAEEAPVAPQEESDQAEPVATEEAADESKSDEHSDFLAELEKTFVKIRRGQFITGVVVQVSEDEVCVNIGYKSDGIIKKEDLTAEGNVAPNELFQQGDEIEAEVITLNDGEGNVRLSRKKIESQIKWKNLVENLDPEAVYECMITKVIKGGVLTKLDGYDAFIPASQLSLKYVEDLGVFVGQTLKVKIIDVDKRQKRFVLSHKEILKLEAEEAEKQMFASFEKGTVIKGVVKRLTDFGAFVDVGGVDGLLHITDISWVRIKHPKDILSENQEIEVRVLNVDPEKRKISLGYKQLQPRPWDMAPEKYQVGDVVQGKVVRIAPFGAFVELEPTIDGLVHISQVANRRIEKVEDVLNLGDIVNVKVLEVNPEKKRISLSIRALLNENRPAEEDREEEQQSAQPSRPRFERNAERRDDYSRRREHSDRGGSEENFSYVLPPVEEAKTSLADLFRNLNDD